MFNLLVLATTNQNKVREFRQFVSEFPVTVKSLSDFGPLPGVVEDGSTFDENAYKKAHHYAKVLGIPQENVTIHVMRSGGAFGRRYYADFIVDTVLLARHFRRPVKVVWSREDDVRHDYFRPASVQRVRASAREPRLSQWQQKVVSHPRETYLERDGSPAEIHDFEFPAGFVPNLLFEYTSVPARVPLGQWRATEHSGNVFVVSSAIDELAHARER